MPHEPGCHVTCTCPSETEQRTAEGAVNIGAFLAHVFCVPCKAEIIWNDLDDIDVSENGADISVGFHGSCQGCGKIFLLEVSDEATDAPAESVVVKSTVTEAEEIAAFNRRGIGK